MTTHEKTADMQPKSTQSQSAQSQSAQSQVESAKASSAQQGGKQSANTKGDEAIAAASAKEPLDQKARVRKAFFYVWIAIGVCVLCGVTIYLLNVMALPVSLFIWTIVIVFSLRGIVDGLERRHVNRLFGTIIAYVVMIAVLGIVGFLMFSPMSGLSEQFANIVSSIPQYISEISKWAKEMSERYADVLNNHQVQSVLNGAFNSISSWSSSFASDAANTAINVGTGIGNMFYAIGFAFVIAFWILLELPAIGRESKNVISPKYIDDLNFLNFTFTRILGGYIKGTIIQCFIIGLACGILFAVAGIPNAPALGVITGVLNIIPIIGPWLGGAVAALTAIFVSPLAVIIALLGTIIIQQFVYTFISPKIMSNSVDIHPALTLIAMIFGSAIGGAMSGLMGSLVGMLLAIPFVAVLKACFIYYFERVTGRQIVAVDGFFFKGKPKDSDIVDPLYDATSGASVKMAQETAEEVAYEDTIHKETVSKAAAADKSNKHNEKHGFFEDIEQHMHKGSDDEASKDSPDTATDAASDTTSGNSKK